MKPLLSILAIAVLPGCGMLDRMVRPDSLPPGDTLRISPGMMMEPPVPCDYPTEPPPADWNQDGGVDGADVWYFFADWADCQADVNTDGFCDGCDVFYFLETWEQGA